MSAGFSEFANPYMDLTAGNAGPLGTGGYTIAVLFKPLATDVGMCALKSGGSDLRQSFAYNGHLFGLDDFSSGDATTLTPDVWWLTAQSKDAGLTSYVHHAWPYAADGSGSMVHAISSPGTGVHGDGSAIDAIRFGNCVFAGKGDYAVIGLYSNLSNAQLDTLKSPNLSAWAALNPVELYSFKNWNGSSGLEIPIGASTISSITGTIDVVADPPGFNFSLAPSGLGGQAGAMAMFF